MIKFDINIKVCVVFFFLITYATMSFSQLVYNNGLGIYAKQGAIVFVDGTVKNQTGIIEIEETGAIYAKIIIQQDFINNSIAGGNGHYKVLGNWFNNNVFNAGTGTVFLEGGNQIIGGSVSTYFNNLTLDGTGLKTQAIDQYCTGILNLKHLELQNENYGFFVQNTNANAIIRTTGFVSALDGGFLSRKTNQNSMYLFPVGSSLGTMRYRPAEITPVNLLANTYTVRMANVLATTETYDVDAIPSGICEVNPEFYHQVNRTAGSSAIKLNIFYNQTQDGEWDGLANWTTTPDLWSTILSTAINAGVPFNEAIIPTWNDFSEIPYILYRIKPEAAIIDPGSLCSNDAPINLTAATTGGTWLGAGVSSTGVFNPTTAGAGTHTITYNVGTGTCAGTDQIDIIVNPSPTVTITNPGDLCSTDLAFNLTVSPTGGIWSGTGFTDTDAGTFSPAAAGIGANNITYELTVLGCTGTDNLTINVFDSPDATITNPGTLCSNDAPINLTAATTGGTWLGAGVSSTGVFNPTTAGAGTHTITYNVGTGTCAGTDQIDIIVNPSPTVTITNPGDLCSTDLAFNLTVSPTGGIWSGTGFTDTDAGTFSPAAAGIGANNITYELTVLGCTGTDNLTINVFDSPDATITNPGTLCSNDAPINLTAATTGGTWLGAGVSSTGVFNPTTAGAGTHTITYNVGTGTCAGTDQIDIIVNPSPTVTITNPGDLCSTDLAFNLTVSPTGGIWSGTGFTDTDAGTFSPAAAGIGANNITYELTVLGCTGTDNLTINVFDSPDATITNPGTLCSNDAPINLTAATTGGTWLGAGVSSTGVFNPTTAGAGTHTITYNVGTGTCAGTDQIDIIVNPSPTVTITNPGDLCSTDLAFNLTVSPTGGIWSGTGFTDTDAGTFSPAAAGAGSFVIAYTVIDNGCLGSGQTIMHVNNSPNVNIDPVEPFCFEDITIQLTAVSEGGIWSGAGMSSNGELNIVQAGVGKHLISYEFEGNCGGIGTIEIEIYPANINAYYVVYNPLCIGGDEGYVEFSLKGGTPPYILEWGVDSYTSSNIISNLFGGNYTVTVIDDNGCSIVVNDIIVENGTSDCLHIPNAFTPNGDGINDEWLIANINSFPKHNVKVFNRWGQEVYYGVFGSDPWDGTLNNKPLPTGSYVYIVEVDEISGRFVGVVTLIK